MSYRYTDIVWEVDLPPNEKIVLLAIAKHANEDGKAWPSQDRLSKYTGLSSRTVIRILSSLEKKKIIHIKKRQSTNLYRIFPLKKPSQEGAAVCNQLHRYENPNVTPCHFPSDTMSLSNVTPCHFPSDTVSPKYIKNISENISKNSFAGDSMKASEIAGKVMNKKPEEGKKVGVNTLEYQWKNHMASAFCDTVKFIPSFTQVEKGQLAQFIKRVSPYDPSKIIQHIIYNWIDFCSFVKDVNGIKTVPEVPKIGFLLKYCGESVNFTEKPMEEIHAEAPPMPSKSEDAEAEFLAELEAMGSDVMTLEDLQELEDQESTGGG